MCCKIWRYLGTDARYLIILFWFVSKFQKKRKSSKEKNLFWHEISKITGLKKFTNSKKKNNIYIYIYIYIVQYLEYLLQLRDFVDSHVVSHWPCLWNNLGRYSKDHGRSLRGNRGLQPLSGQTQWCMSCRDITAPKNDYCHYLLILTSVQTPMLASSSSELKRTPTPHKGHS